MTGKKLYILLLVLGAATLLGLYFGLGPERTWRIWNIPYKEPFFYDLRMVTASAESYAEGFDPAYDNPYDPEQRYFNYPRVWYILLGSGIDLQDTLWFGALLVLGFFISLATLQGEFEPITAIIMILAIFSPAVLLGVERGNVDLAIFTLAALALWSVGFSKTFSLLILLLAVALKLVPMFGAGYFLNEDKRGVKYTIISLAATTLYVGLDWEGMQHIFSHTQKGADVSYGVSVLPAKFWPYLGNYQQEVTLALYLAAFGLILGMGFLALRNRERWTALDADQLRMFRLGAGIYLGTFLLGNNWDYRLMFLIFAIPQIVSWQRKGSGSAALAAKICLVAILLSLWYLEIWQITAWAGTAGRVFSFLLDEGMNWVLFAGLLYLFVGSLPDYLLKPVRAFLDQHLTHPEPEIQR